MTSTTFRAASLAGLLVTGVAMPAWAQTPPGAEPSLTCGLFPLACPHPVPPPPPPLLGTPEEQAATATPEAPAKPAKSHHHVRKQKHKAAQ